MTIRLVGFRYGVFALNTLRFRDGEHKYVADRPAGTAT